MKDMFKDKRMIVLYVIVGIGLLLGVTYALNDSAIAFNINTAYIRVDEDAYGDTTFDTSNITFSPILDSKVETSLDNVIKIDFMVGGNQNNNASNIIYDIALSDMNVHCNLLSPYIKWKLIKNGTEISTGSLDYKFDTITDGRLVLTDIQQDLAPYSASKSGYDSYTFYMWFSDSCQSDLATCVANGQTGNQNDLLGKMLSGKVEVELYTESKKKLVRKPGTAVDTNTCTTVDAIYLNTKPAGSYVAYTGNNGCSGKSCTGQNVNYVNNKALGYCPESQTDFFTSNGWRIAYVKEETVYLVSGGSPECMCTGIDSNFSYSSIIGKHLDFVSNDICTNYVDSSSSYQQHMDNLNEVALKYCNTDYVYGGNCDVETVRSIGETDFISIDSSYGDFLTCADGNYDVCKTDNDLLDIGTYYWAGYYIDRIGRYAFYSYGGGIRAANYNKSYAVRPIIRLSSTVEVTGGSGTMDDPYQISN